MPSAFAILVGLQLVGEVLRQTLHLPLPGPLIGMVLLTVLLVARGSAGAAAQRAVPPPLLKAANALIANMGLLFVPAGVGIIAELGVLQQEWLPILAGLLVSTVLGLAVTGLVMHHVSRVAGAGRRALPEAAAE
ncbi:MAG: holin-like protein [Acetobacteraceae bacterium]|jgi:holin-like protein|nr:LrgA family protein [Rhodopila sp.]MEA2725576.1 holin-like protein [Acetobacteraceae bacterium]